MSLCLSRNVFVVASHCTTFIISTSSEPSIYINYVELVMKISDHCVLLDKFSLFAPSSSTHFISRRLRRKSDWRGRIARNFSPFFTFNNFISVSDLDRRCINADCTFVHFNFTHYVVKIENCIAWFASEKSEIVSAGQDLKFRGDEKTFLLCSPVCKDFI